MPLKISSSRTSSQPAISVRHLTASEWKRVRFFCLPPRYFYVSAINNLGRRITTGRTNVISPPIHLEEHTVFHPFRLKPIFSGERSNIHLENDPEALPHVDSRSWRHLLQWSTCLLATSSDPERDHAPEHGPAVTNRSGFSSAAARARRGRFVRGTSSVRYGASQARHN